MPDAVQFCVGMENRPGTLAKLCDVLSEAEVNIEAMFVADDQQGCWVNMIVTPPEAAEQALRSAGYHFFTEQVLTFTVKNRPGALGKLAREMAGQGVNINYVYGGGGPAGTPFTLVMSVADKAEEAEIVED